MAKPIAAQESYADLPFPVKGVDLSQAYALQRPGTTPTGQNVRAYDCLAFRQRGGSRPGLTRYIPAQIPGASLIQELAVVVGTGYTAPGPTIENFIVQQTTPVAGTSGTLTATFNNPVTAGNSIVVMEGGTGGTLIVPQDSAGNTYNRVAIGFVSNVVTGIYVASAVTSVGSVSIPIVGSIGTITACVYEVAGLAASPAGAGQNPSGVDTHGSGIALTTTHSPSIVFACVQANQSVARTAGSGWFDLPTSADFWAGFLQVPSSGTSVGGDLAWSFGASSYWCGCEKELKGA